MDKMKAAVMGAGAVGCYFGAMLARAGHTVTLVGRPQHVDAVKARGLELDMAGFHGFVPMDATTEASGVAGADVILFCVKSSDTENAGRQMLPHLKADAIVLSLQNGVDNAERLEKVIGRIVIPAVVYVATEMEGPGHVKHHGRGELELGASEPSARIAAAFTAAKIPSVVSQNVAVSLWEKLIVNCAYNALSAIVQLPYGRLIEVAGVPDVMQDVVSECVSVAHAMGIAIPGEIATKVAAIARAMPKQYSSTAQDLARGKPSEIDYLNGYVVRKGAELGVATPVNQTLLALVKLAEHKASLVAGGLDV
jgi:2-dehydropantoate 2-reductase